MKGMKNPNHAQAGQNLFMSSVFGLANVLAFIVAFLGGPTLFHYSGPLVLEIAYQAYGSEILGVAYMIWYGVCYLLLFYLARATIGTALTLGGLALVTRFM